MFAARFQVSSHHQKFLSSKKSSATFKCHKISFTPRSGAHCSHSQRICPRWPEWDSPSHLWQMHTSSPRTSSQLNHAIQCDTHFKISNDRRVLGQCIPSSGRKSGRAKNVLVFRKYTYERRDCFSPHKYVVLQCTAPIGDVTDKHLLTTESKFQISPNWNSRSLFSISFFSTDKNRSKW